jgi:peptidoglycan/LPS O-acetylase OafA/YrhL
MRPPDGAPSQPPTSRLAIVDLLRIIAALSVMWYHFGFRTRSELVRSTTHWGFTGVQVFFVVSGFIIPWALARGGFSWPRDGVRFILKRTLRLDQSYLVALAAGIGSSLVAAWLLFILVERPALIWASRITYSGNAPPSPAPPHAGG